MAKHANSIKLVNTARWCILRLKKLQVQPLFECDECKAHGKNTPTKEVPQIVLVEFVTTIEQMEVLMFDFNNLMSVSHESYVRIHQEMFPKTKAKSPQINGYL